MTSSQLQSHSVEIEPVDSRCRFWAKLVRAGTPLPIPELATSAYGIPGNFLRRSDDKLFPGDMLFTGESNHHRRKDRGWTYRVRVVTQAGEYQEFSAGFGEQKKQMKAQGMPPELLKGAGDIAAMVRIGHGVRMGLAVLPN